MIRGKERKMFKQAANILHSAAGCEAPRALPQTCCATTAREELLDKVGYDNPFTPAAFKVLGLAEPSEPTPAAKVLGGVHG
jgi:hypothetical protein